MPNDETTYRADFRGTAQLMRTPEMHAVLAAVATGAIPFARSISPDAIPYGVGYVSSFEVHGGGTEMIAGARRAVAELVNTEPYATAVELGDYGSSRADTGHHVLARTADHIERG